MSTIQEAILQHSRRLPEETILSPKSLLHLGSRDAVDQALSRMARSGKLLRIQRGRYVRPRQTRFGPTAPSAHEIAGQLAKATGEIIVPSGAAEANRLGLTTQVPVRTVYLTSGPSRRINLGRQTLELRNAPGWQLSGPGTKEGAILRAAEWLGPEGPLGPIERIVSSLTPEERRGLLVSCAGVPDWLARRLARALFPEEAAGVTVGNG